MDQARPGIHFRTDTIFILNTTMENISEKKIRIELCFFSAHCIMKLYACTKFHENIDDRFTVIEWIRFLKVLISKGHYS